MRFADYAPVASPSLEQQRDAMQKGLGRAMQWAQTGQLDDVPLLNACLQDRRFDMQVDETRGDWLWGIIQSVSGIARFRDRILAALQEMSEGRDACQLCELAFHYATTGGEFFRARLYEIVQTKPFPDQPWLAEEQILALDGADGLSFAARVRGTQLAERPWDWDDSSLVDAAIGQLGRQRVRDTLGSSMDESIKRFHERWLEHLKTSEQDRSLTVKERMKQMHVSEIIAAAESNERACPYFRGWGMVASVEDLEAILHSLLMAQQPSIIARYLKVFSNRAYPRLDEKLILLCQHEDEEVRRRAFAALKKNSHPMIREFALAALHNGITAGNIAGLFISNYQPGDEERILDSIVLPTDDAELHWLFLNAVKVLENNPQADCSKLGIVVYAITPCSVCRYHAARLLHNRMAAPRWLTDECKNDSVEDIRKLANE